MSPQHGREAKGGLHGSSQKSPQPKSSDFDKYSDYSNDKYDYEGEEDDYEDDGAEFQQSKDSGGFGGQGKGRYGKDPMNRSNQRGLPKQQQQCMFFTRRTYCVSSELASVQMSTCKLA